MIPWLGSAAVRAGIAEDLFALGLDVLTSGNHIWDKRDIYDYLDRQPRLLRPANYAQAPGRGPIPPAGWTRRRRA